MCTQIDTGRRRAWNSVPVVTYSSADVCRATGATYRQVDHWARTGRIPGQDHGPGYGGRRQWTPEQVERVRQLVEASKLRTRWADLITS